MKTREQLGERKLKILHAIIQTYLETGEPVGSRTISKYSDLKLSSATIRNQMADLEDLGYIIQPHTSAGRIPSDKGYRLYVDMLMEEKEQELQEMQEQMLEKADKMDQLLKQAARVLASNTNYATMVSTPMNNRNRIKFIQLSKLDYTQIIAVIVLGTPSTLRPASNSWHILSFSVTPSIITIVVVLEYQPIVHRLRLSASPQVPTNPEKTNFTQETLDIRPVGFSPTSRY